MESPVINLGDSLDHQARSMLEWPDEFIAMLKPRLLALHSGAALAPADLAELNEYGILQAQTGKITVFGTYLLGVVVQEGWEEADDEFMSLLKGLKGKAILDVGGNTGWSLRHMPASPDEAIIIDVDARSLVLGYRWARQEQRRIQFELGCAEKLPFADSRFDCVICRNAITYMHQRTAIREMCRVLKPQGTIYLRFERIWFDIRKLLHATSLRSFCGHLRDLFWGLCQAVTGWQMVPDNAIQDRNRGGVPNTFFYRCGRTFGTLPQYKVLLKRGGCSAVEVLVPRKVARCLGIPTQHCLIARKVDRADS